MQNSTCIHFYVNAIFCKFIFNFCYHFFCNKMFLSILGNDVKNIKYSTWVSYMHLVTTSGPNSKINWENASFIHQNKKLYGIFPEKKSFYAYI